MKFKLNNQYVRWGLTAFFVIAASIIFYYLIFHSSNILTGLSVVANVLMPVVFGFAMAYLLTPVLNQIEKKCLEPLCTKLKLKPSRRRKSINRGIGIFLSLFLFIALIYLLLYMMISQLMPSIQNILQNFNRYTDNFMKWTDKLLADYPREGEYLLQIIDRYSEKLDAFIQEIPANLAVWLRTVTNTATNILGVLWDFIIGLIISIYLMASKEKFAAQTKKITYALFERDTANIVIRNFRFTHHTFIGFLGGKIIDSIIIGVLCFIGTTLLHTPYAALVSVIVGVTNIIPFFGPYLGAIPSAILILVVDITHPMNCVYFLIFILILQQFDGNFLGPKILGDSTGLTSFWVIFAITFFGGFFGVFGMIVGVPAFAVIYAAVKSVVNSLLRKKNMPTDTGQYEKLDYVDDDGFHQSSPAPVTGRQTSLLGRKKKKISKQQKSSQDSEKSDK